jgi:hypothetical protein
MLEILWKDLFHVRGQTWRTLEIEAGFVLLLMSADYFLHNLFFTLLMTCVVALSILSGLKAALHHRKTQLRTLAHIKQVEEELGLIRPGLIDNLNVSSEIFLADAFNTKCNSTPIFLIRMHLALLIITIFYPIASHGFSHF